MDVEPVYCGRHTEALAYSLWERFVFKMTGRWPEAVVDRRLAASDADMAAARRKPSDGT